MRYVIDAFNLIHAHEPLYEAFERFGFAQVRTALVRMLAPIAVEKGVEGIVAVFDGSPKAGGGMRRERATGFVGASNVELIFSDPGRGADRTIHDYVEAAKSPGGITVVSDDKFVIQGARSAQAHTLSCRAFLKKVHALRRSHQPSRDREDPRKYRGLTESEIKEWMDYFGFREDE